MTRIELDTQRCAGHALCAATAPEIYELDDVGYCLPPPAHIDDSARAAAIAGAEACPEQALAIVDDGSR